MNHTKYPLLDEAWQEKITRETKVKKEVVELESVFNRESLTIYIADKIISLSPLIYFKKLESISIHSPQVKDLEPLGHLRTLTQLTITSSDANLRPVKNLSKLRELTLYGSFNRTPSTILQKLEFIHIDAITTLEYLTLKDFNVDSIILLKDFGKLKQLSLVNTHVDDISPLKGLKKLESLNISGSPVQSFEILSSLGVHTLYADQSNLSSLKPFYKTRKMLTLYCRRSNVTFEEILRFRKSLSRTSLTSLILVSDYNDNNDSFTQALKNNQISLKELGSALVEWVDDRLKAILNPDSISSPDDEDRSIEKRKHAILILEAFFTIPYFKRDADTEKSFQYLLHSAFICLLNIDAPNVEKKVLDVLPQVIVSKGLAVVLARFFAKKNCKERLFDYASRCCTLGVERKSFQAIEFEPFLNNKDFIGIISKARD